MAEWKAEKSVGSGSLAHKVSEVKKTLMETGVEATVLQFWQMIWLQFVCVLKIK